MGRRKIEPPTDRLLTTGEVSTMTGYSADCIRTWSDEGKIPHFRSPGGQRRYWKKEIEKWLKDLRQNVTGESQKDNDN